MKKPHITAAALLLTAALLLSGCSKRNDTSLTDTDSGNSSEISDSNSSSENSGNSENSDSTPEPLKPDGEPTFLLCPDGEPIYTSEITEMYTESDSGDKKTLTIAETEQMARSGEGDFTVKCEGFVYGYIPERSFNIIDDPETFKYNADEKNYDFIGKETDIHGVGERSKDFIRVKTGDKFGTLTVKNAYTHFNNQWKTEALLDIPGACVSDYFIEFDGEIELTGYVKISPTDTLYGEGGDMIFYPDGDSSGIIPHIGGMFDPIDREYYHCASVLAAGYFGDDCYGLGNLFNVDCDTSGLHPGDELVKVRVTLDNIRCIFSMPGGIQVDLKYIEIL